MSNFKIITKQQHLDNIPTMWHEQYKHTKSEEIKEITNKLNNLSLPIDANVINTIIGNNSWTKLNCNVCNEDSNKVLIVRTSYYYNDDELYDEPALTICEKCLNKAYKLMEE